MNEKMSKRRIQIIDFQKQEIEEKEETTLLIRLHIFYKFLWHYPKEIQYESEDY